MNWRNVVMVLVTICLSGCGSKESKQSSAKSENLALSEAQKQHCGLIREALKEMDAAQTASDTKRSQAAIIRILDQYKALTSETKATSGWVGRCVANTPDKSGKPIAEGVLLADPEPSSDNRIFFVLKNADGAHLSPGALARFSGNIEHVKVEYLTFMQGRFFEASVSTRGEIGFDATGLNLRGLTKARVLVEISGGQMSSYAPAT